jgi:hypothetical protein
MIIAVAFVLYLAYIVARQAGESGKGGVHEVVFGAIVALCLSTVIGGAGWGDGGIVGVAFGIIVAAGSGYSRGERTRREKIENERQPAGL